MTAEFLFLSPYLRSFLRASVFSHLSQTNIKTVFITYYSTYFAFLCVECSVWTCVAFYYNSIKLNNCPLWKRHWWKPSYLFHTYTVHRSLISSDAQMINGVWDKVLKYPVCTCEWWGLPCTHTYTHLCYIRLCFSHAVKVKTCFWAQTYNILSSAEYHSNNEALIRRAK